MAYTLIEKNSIIFTICSITLLLSMYLVSYSYSLSPVFVRQDIIDESNDMILSPTFSVNKSLTIDEGIAENLTSCGVFDKLSNNTLIPYGDIKEVSYLSNGELFNSTLWLNDFVNLTNPIYPEGLDINIALTSEDLKNNSVLLKKSSDYIDYQLNRHDDLLLDKSEHIRNEPVILGGNPAYMSEITTIRNDSFNTEETYRFIVGGNGNYIYYLGFSSLSDRFDRLIDDFDSLIKSIQFLNHTSDSNFENATNFYKNETLGISFKYPNNSTIIPLPEANGVRITFPGYDLDLLSKSYQILIDVKSTFDNGMDYINKIWYENKSKEWIDTLYETRSLRTNLGSEETASDENLNKISEKTFTGFPTDLLKKQTRQNFFVPFSINLDYLNNPPSYDVYFVSTSLYKTGDNMCNIIDTTSFAPIPPPDVNITAIPQSLEMRPNEENDVEIKVDPGTRLPYLIDLSTTSREIINPIYTSFNSSNVNKGIFITNLKVNVSDPGNINSPRYYSLPITATVFIEPSHRDEITNHVIENKLFSNVSSTTYLMIKVNPPLNLDDHLKYLSESIFSPLGGILTTLGLLIGGIVGVGRWMVKNKANKGQQ